MVAIVMLRVEYLCLLLDLVLITLGKVITTTSYSYNNGLTDHLDAKFDDVDEADKQIDTIADGGLYRIHRLLMAGDPASRGKSRRRHGRGALPVNQPVFRGGEPSSRANHGTNRGGHAFSPSRNGHMTSTKGAPSIPKG